MARAGQLPYIDPEAIESLDENLETCPECDKAVAECCCGEAEECAENEHPLDESTNSDLEDINFEESLPELDASLDIDEDKIDNDINAYFNENYEKTLIYHTEKGTIDENGVITLKGSVMMDEKDNDITFTLTPSNTLNENISDRTYIVTSDLSTEKFEFTFDK